jgi:hypothetical protein
LDKVNDSIDHLHSLDCIRAIVKIGDYKLSSPVPEFKQIGNVKVFGGYIK